MQLQLSRFSYTTFSAEFFGAKLRQQSFFWLFISCWVQRKDRGWSSFVFHKPHSLEQSGWIITAGRRWKREESFRHSLTSRVWTGAPKANISSFNVRLMLDLIILHWRYAHLPIKLFNSDELKAAATNLLASWRECKQVVNTTPRDYQIVKLPCLEWVCVRLYAG